MSRRYFETKTAKILRELKISSATLGVTFVTDREIAVLKGRYLGKKMATDVLSFPFSPSPCVSGIKGEGAFLGDIVISIDTVRKQCKELKVSVQKRSLFLIIHGLLHLLGFDHIKNSDWKKMTAKENQLWELVNK